MSGIPAQFKGAVKLEAFEGFLKGPFVLRDAEASNTNLSFHITQKGLEIRWPQVVSSPAAPSIVSRLFRAVGAKKEAATPVTVLRLQSPRLAQAFRESDDVQMFFDRTANTLAMSCNRQGQLAFAFGQIGSLLPLKGAANLLFESISEENENRDQLVLRTSLRPLELKIGRVIPLGYYNMAALKQTDANLFISIIRSGVSLTMDDLKGLVREWNLTVSEEML